MNDLMKSSTEKFEEQINYTLSLTKKLVKKFCDCIQIVSKMKK